MLSSRGRCGRPAARPRTPRAHVPDQPVADHDPARPPIRRAVLLHELDGLPCYHAVGGIEVAATQARWEELHRRYGRGLSFGLAPQLLSRRGRRALPLVDPERILGGILVPDDGIAKALRAAEALGRAAIATGARRRSATARSPGWTPDGGRVRGVRTSAGHVRADHVVLAAGIWGPRVMRLAGQRLPLHPVEHIYALTAPLPELRGATGRGQPSDPAPPGPLDVPAPGRRDLRHRLLPAPAAAVAPPRRSRPPARARTRPSARSPPSTSRPRARRPAACCRRCATSPLTRAFNGLMSFTPDGLPLLGELSRDARAVAAEAIWVTHAGGAAEALADLMVHGEAGIDLHECDPERFDDHGLSPAFARARGAQQYREVYDVIHPREPVRVARPLRVSPFHARQVALGAEMFESAGWERPQWYPGGGASPPHRSAAPGARGSGRRSVARRAPRDPRARGPVRPLAVHEDHGPRPRRARPTCSTSRANDVDRPPGHDRLHRDAHAGRPDHVRPHRHARRRGRVLRRHRRRGRQARPRLDAPPPAAGRLGRADRRDVAPVLPRPLGPARAGHPRRDQPRTTSPTTPSRT